MKIIPMGFQPICSKEMPYELTVSFLLTPDKPGIPQPIKLQEQHRKIFPLNKQIDEDSGRAISEWAAGGEKSAKPKSPKAKPKSPKAKPKDDFKEIMERESKRIGEEKFVEILGDMGYESIEMISQCPRDEKIRVYKAIVAIK
jgi:hypothetical protein